MSDFLPFEPGAKVLASTGGGGGVSEFGLLRFNPAKRAAAIASGTGSGSIVVGWRFLVLQAGVSVTGADYYAAWSGTKSIKIRLWDGDGNPLASKTVAIAGPALATVTFDTPVAINLPSDPSKPLTISAWETGGSVYGAGPESLAVTYPPPDGAVQLIQGCYGGGDIYPPSNAGTQYPYGVSPRISIA